MYSDRDELMAPRLGGLALRTLVGVLESPLGGALAEKLMVDAGLERFRQTSPGPADVTTFPVPVPPVDPGEARPPEVLAARATAARPPPGVASVGAHARAYRARTVDPQEVVRRLHVFLEGLEGGDEPMNFFISRKPEEALRDARASAERLAVGAARGVLEGVPVVLKDALDLAGFPTTQGTRFLTEPKAEDSVVARRLKAAGAVILGKANMHEPGGNPLGRHSDHHGPARNPWRRTHLTGGSSSGAAAVVAAGVCPVAIGMGGGGGSIRIPASLCGVVALKATPGRIPNCAGSARAWSAGQVGPLGLTVDDVAAAYAVIAGPDPADARSLKAPPPHLAGYEETSLRGLTVGHCEALFQGADAAVVAHTRRALEVLQGRGATLVEVPCPDLNTVRWAHTCIVLSELAEAMLPHATAEATRFGLDARLHLGLGRHLRATDLVHALRHRHRFTEQALELLAGVDLVLTPTTATTAPPEPASWPHQDEAERPVAERLLRYTRFSALTGCPGLALPSGFDAAGLPTSVHLMARPHEEHLLLRVGRVLEAEVERRTPEVHVDVLG